MFANKKEAKLLRWHEEGHNKDGMLRHPADCAQWRHFDNTNGWFGDAPRNIRFALSIDGMKELKLNFSMMKSHDCHVLMTSVLPVAIKNVLPVKVCETVMSLCFLFNDIEQKVIDDKLLTDLDRRLH